MKYSFLVLFCFFCKITFSQNIAVENSRAMNIIYPWENPLTVVVENIPCASLYLKTDNGRIEGSNCNFSIFPNSIGRATIAIYQISDSDTLFVGEKIFRVKRFPLSKPYLGNNSSGFISLSSLKAQRGVIVRIKNFDINANVKVLKFRISFIRKNELLEQIENKSPKFSDEIKEKFNTLKSGDKILIDKVYVRTSGVKKSLRVENSEYIIE